MPLVLAGIMMLGVSETLGWRVAMVVPGLVLFLTGLAYWHFTQDAPDGNFSDLRRRGELVEAKTNMALGQVLQQRFGTGASGRFFWCMAPVLASS